MANPVLHAITVGNWIKVLSSVEKFAVYPKLLSNRVYNWTYRVAGEAAPTNGDLSQAVEISPLGLRDSSPGEPIDVYVAVTGATAGLVRADANPSGIDLILAILTAVYTVATASFRTEEIDPLSQHFVSEILADITDGTDATYYYYVDMNGFRKLGLQLELDDGSGDITVTIEGTLQDDGTAPASCVYQDITNDTFGSLNFTASDMLIDNVEKLAAFKYIRVKVVAASGANDADWTIYAKRLY